MKRFLSLFLLVSSLLLLFSCEEKESFDTEGYGYVQVKLQKKTTRSLIEGNALDHLADARKIRLSLMYQGKSIEQTLNLMSASVESAEYLLTSEEVKMQSGEYKVMGYALYGDYKEGDMAELLQVVSMDEPVSIVVKKNQMSEETFYVEAKQYGKFSAHIVRLEPQTRAGQPVYSELFEYDDIDSVQLVLERNVGGITYREDRKVKAHKGNTDAPTFDTDSINLQVGKYRLSHFELFNKRRQFMYAQDVEVAFEVEDFKLSTTEVGVQLPETAGVRDGIALKQIWDAMDGENWSFHDQGAYGGNWVFRMSDGSPRPLSAWTNQPGVVVSHMGRVISLNLGAFNPMGDVPDAIGQLDALERLYLGEHTDEIYYTLEGVGGMQYTISPYQIAKSTDLRLHRMEIAKERAFIRQMNSIASPLMKVQSDEFVKNMKYATGRVQTGTYDPANRITGISEEIGKLKNLTELYIANSMITKLPTSLAKLENVTDLELYNNPFTELDGDIFKGMTYLTSVYIDRLYNLSEEQLLGALDKMCESCGKIQLLYLCNLKLSKLPSKLNRLTDLRLLDCSNNKITSIPSLLPMAPIQVILDHNLLTSLPANLFNVDDIESFSCTDNRLKEFPAVLSNLKGNYSFESVNLTGNRMHGFQEGFEGIRCEKLIMASNYLGRLPEEKGHGFMPEEFAKTKSIINYLDVSFNNIDSIRNAAIKGLTYLQALDVSKNELRYLPSLFNAENFPYLTGLDLSHNQLRGFPENVLNVTSLQQLLLADQGYFRDATETKWVRTMTEWPTYLHVHPSLTNLDVKGNDFRTVVNFPANLTTLNVTNNPNIKMEIPSDVLYRMSHGLFIFYYDEEQDIH